MEEKIRIPSPEREDWNWKKSSCSGLFLYLRIIGGTMGLYKVEGGVVSVVEPVAEVDGLESVLVLAGSEDEALEGAKAYDAGLLQADNHIIEGSVVVAVKAGWSR